MQTTHEGIHALFSLTGVLKDDDNIIFSDPDNNGNESQNIDVEEYNTRQIENEVRGEQGLNLRAIPEATDASGVEGKPLKNSGAIKGKENFKPIKFDKGKD